MTWRTPLNDANGSPAARDTAAVRGSRSWKVVAKKLMCGDIVLPVAHHRSEADVVEEVCGRTDPFHRKSVINSHVHHRQLSLHKQTRKHRAGALMLPSSCLDGSIARVGLG